MKYLISAVRLISNSYAYGGKTVDLIIENGIITSIGEKLKGGDDFKVISAPGLCCSTGWFDLHVNFGDPGYEIKETLQSGSYAAAQGGFTGVLLMPSTQPPLSDRSGVEYIFSRCGSLPVDVAVAGCLSSMQKGNDISEMYDMHLAGVNVFTDDKFSVADPSLLTRAMLYASDFDSRIFSFADDKSFSSKGLVNEGVYSTMLGLKGMPYVAEEIMVVRDLALAFYSQTPIHFSTISSLKSVDAIRKAKRGGAAVTCDVSAYHLLFNDSVLEQFDSNYKLLPPLRSEEDRIALIEGIADGTIDAICSDHCPQNPESKITEFELASFGIAGVETAFAAARTAIKNIVSLEKLIECFTYSPRRIARVNTVEIKEGLPANLTFFHPDVEWVVAENHLRSKSKNNPVKGKKLTGKPFGTFYNGKYYPCI